MEYEIMIFEGRTVTDELRTELAAFIASRNSDPAQHIGYLGEEAGDVAAELRELEGDHAFALARAPSGALVGLLGAEWDPDVDRAWLLGPWGPADVVDRLYADLGTVIPARIGEEELFVEAANVAVVGFAARHGFDRHGRHVIQRFPRDLATALPAEELPTLSPDQHAQFVELHDACFPNTHTPGAAMLAKDAPIRVIVEDGVLLGYVVLKLRPEYDDAQIDYIAVAESARGRGIGARLLAAALREVFADPRFTKMDLVTANPVARALYEKVGFTTLKEMISFRRRRS